MTMRGLRNYMGAVSVLAGRALRGFTDPALRDRIVAWTRGEPATAPQSGWTPSLPRVTLQEAAPVRQVALPVENAADGNVSPLELIALAGFAAAPGVERIFEIGTFNGFTSLTFAMNSRAGATVHTLDLPPEGERSTALNVAQGDRKYIADTRKGHFFQLGTRPEEAKVTQLFGDSARFDYSPYEGRMDLVFVDGSHSYDYVKSDTEVALRLLKPGGGAILWHDYNAWWPGVARFLEERVRQPDCSGLRNIAGTSLVFLRK